MFIEISFSCNTRFSETMLGVVIIDIIYYSRFLLHKDVDTLIWKCTKGRKNNLLQVWFIIQSLITAMCHRDAPIRKTFIIDDHACRQSAELSQ